MTTPTKPILIFSAVIASSLTPGLAQTPPAAAGNPANREAAALAEPFVGITAEGKVQPG